MGDDVMVGLGAIVVLGVGMQWLARRIRVPAILLLIAAGLVAGPWLGVVDPDEIFGDSLFTLVSMAVALLLFEGGLGLDVAELREQGPRPVVQLVTGGVLITWVAVAVVAVPLFGLDTELAVLLGALLVVSGPTVVGPLLQLARPRQPTSTILRWEGIVIDPVGATLALCTLKVIMSDSNPVAELLSTTVIGVLVGVAVAALLIAALRTFSVPDDLEPAVTFMMVIAAYVLGEVLFEEAGLFAATALGIVLANQSWVQVRRIAAFGHDVGVLVLGGLFVVLAARVSPADFRGVITPSIVLVVVLVLVVRPVVGWVSTIRARLPVPDRLFIGGLAPRGIVAAATSSLFALRLDEKGMDDGRIEAIVFSVIVGTCLVYGLGSPALARALGVAEPDPDEVLLIGAQPWLFALADALSSGGEAVTVLATGARPPDPAPPWRLVTTALVDPSVPAVLRTTRSAVIASRDHEHNGLALARCLEVLPRKEVYVLPASNGGRPTHHHDDASAIGGAPVAALAGEVGGVEELEEIEELEQLEAAPARAWERRPFTPGTTQQAIEEAYAQGGIHVVTGPQAERDGEIVLATWGPDGRLDLAPRRGPVAADASAVVVGAGEPPDGAD